MSVSNKLRAILNIAEKKPADLADCLDVSVQAVRNKFSRDSFSVSDIIKISHSLGWELQCKSPNGQTVSFSLDDLRTPTATTSNKFKTEATEQYKQPTAKVEESVTPKEEYQYRTFTEQEAAKIDLNRLLSDNRYQVEIAMDFGMEVLSTLVNTARQQSEPSTSS